MRIIAGRIKFQQPRVLSVIVFMIMSNSVLLENGVTLQADLMSLTNSCAEIAPSSTVLNTLVVGIIIYLVLSSFRL